MDIVLKEGPEEAEPVIGFSYNYSGQLVLTYEPSWEDIAKLCAVGFNVVPEKRAEDRVYFTHPDGTEKTMAEMQLEAQQKRDGTYVPPVDPAPWAYALLHEVNERSARSAVQETGGFVFAPRDGYDQRRESYR